MAAKETDPQGLFFKPDGLKMYTTGVDGNTVDEYNLSVAWDVTTATYFQEKDMSVKADYPMDLFFTSDGLKMYTMDWTDTTVDEYDLSVAWDVSTATYSQEKSDASETSPSGLFFKPDGTKMYTIGTAGDSVDEYNLSVAWDVTTAVYSQEISVNAKEALPQGLFFKPDGLKMYTTGADGKTVDEYNLGTAWDVITATYVQEKDVSAYGDNPMGLFFKPDGLKMYIIEADGLGADDTVDEYNLGTAWDVDSAVYSQEINVAANEPVPTGLFFKPDGLKMYTIGSNGDSVDEYNLSTAWDVTSAVYSQDKSVTSYESMPEGLFFKPDGLKMYTVGTSGKTVDEYNLGGVLFSKESTINAGFTAGHPFTSGVAIDYTVQVGDALSVGTTYYWRVRAIDPGGSNIYGDWSGIRSFATNTSPTVALNTPNDEAEFTDTTPTLNFKGIDADTDDVEYNVQVGEDMWDVSTATYVREKDVRAKEMSPEGLFFKPDGLKMYTIGSDGDTVDEYDLIVAWDVTTAVYSQEISVSAKEASPRGLFFKPDGLKMYTIGADGDTVDEYNLSVAWDVTTAVYSQEISVNAKETWPTGLFFKPDGLKMYTIGFTGTVDEYNLSVAWDVTTAVYSQEISVAAKETAPKGLFFTSDGLKMYTVGTSGKTVDEYNLGTAWDVTEAVYSQEISVNAKDTWPTGLFFKPGGTKMYIMGGTGQAVDEYDLGTVLINKVSTTDPGFTAGNPYTSGEAKEYTVQAGDTLSGGSYYWKVRAIDPDGSNTYGAWCIPRTFTLPPAAPTNVSATDGDHTDKVTITWTKSSGATGYKVYEGTNILDTLGDVATYDDTLAPAPTITPGTATASDGTSGAHSALSLSGQSANNGTSRTYKVVAYNGVGDSPDSDTDDGYRGAGGLTYQWQRSAADSDASYSNISGATTSSYNDTDAAVSPDGRYYRCVEDATGATQQTSTSDRGNKLYNASPTVALNTPGDAVTITDTTPTLNFTGTDGESEDVEYHVQVGTSSSVWDVTSATYSQEISISAKESTPTGLFFKPDGLKMYTTGYGGVGTVDEYNLGTAWDVDSAVYSQEKSVDAKESQPTGLFFKPDGLKMYTMGWNGKTVDEYNLSVAWDVDSALYSQEISVNAKEESPQGLFFKPDGTKMYTIGNDGDTVDEYNLGTAWDVDSAVYSQEKSVNSYELSPSGLFFKADGLKMYVIGFNGNTVDEYNLSTAWDVDSANYSQEKSVNSYQSQSSGLFFKPDGTKMYTIGSVGPTVDEYDVGDLFVTWDVTTAVYSQEISVNAKEALPADLFFKPDGTKMYTIGTDGVTVDEYNLSVTWDVASAAYSQEISVNAKEVFPQGLFFKPDGTKMYTTGTDGEAVYEYNLSIAWNVQSASYVDEYDVSTKETLPQGLFFKPDGTKMYTIGDDGDTVDEYNLSTAWDVQSASYVDEKDVSGKETSPMGVFFKPDGTKMYTTGAIGGTVDEYNLNTAWDVASAAYSQEIEVNAKDASPMGVFFKPDGTKMYTMGAYDNTVDEYNLGGLLISEVSTTDAGFTAGHPFTSGEAKEYTVQAGDALSIDTTYYWRVRAIDPGGGNAYGAWSGTRSFTINGPPTVALNSPDDEAGIADTTPTLNFTGTDANTDDVEYNVQVGEDMWDVTTATYVQEKDAQLYSDGPDGLFFKPDGTKMYILGGLTGSAVHEYDLAIAWDVTSATYSQEKSVYAFESSPQGLFFKPDGTKMYTIGENGDTVDEYNLSTAWDVLSAVYYQEEDVSGKEAWPMGLFFKPDGTKMYTVGYAAGGTVDEYNLSTAWNVQSASYVDEKDVNGKESSPKGVFFKPDGTKMYTIGDNDNAVDEYDLTTAWDVTSAVYSQEISVNAQETQPECIFFTPDGVKMYIGGRDGDVVDEYDLGTSLIDKVSTADPGFTAGNPYTSGVAIDYTVQAGSALSVGTDYFWRVRATDPTGSNVYGAWSTRVFTIIPNASPTVALNTPADAAPITDTTPTLNFTGTDGETEDVEYNVQVGDDLWDVSTATHVQEIDVTSYESNPHGVFFKSDGLKMYTIGGIGTSTVDEYNLSTAWDVTTASHFQEKNVTGNDSVGTGLFFKPDGLKMYIIGTTGNAVDEYNLSTAWDVDSAVYSQEKDVSGYILDPRGLFFKPDGLKMYTIGANAATVDEYNLSIAWDVDSANYFQEKDVSGYDITPSGVFFTSNGLKMYTIGYTGKTVDEYNLSTAWDVDSATYSQEKDVSINSQMPRGLFFKPDGTKMYIVETFDDTIDEYDLGTVLIDKVSTADPGFTPDNPYASGEAKEYTVQAADILSSGATYYWRVRAIDPGGSNAYGAWDTRTFTIPQIATLYRSVGTSNANLNATAG
ncbi:hypothetical protein ACFL2J_07685, partial [Candidatus Omnitrophota bacterium]